MLECDSADQNVLLKLSDLFSFVKKLIFLLKFAPTRCCKCISISEDANFPLVRHNRFAYSLSVITHTAGRWVKCIHIIICSRRVYTQQ